MTEQWYVIERDAAGVHRRGSFIFAENEADAVRIARGLADAKSVSTFEVMRQPPPHPVKVQPCPAAP